MKTSQRLVFFGTENFSVPSLEALLSGGWTVCAVVTKPDAPAGRGRKIRMPKIKQMAEINGVKIFQPDKLRNIKDDIKALSPTLGVLTAYGKIIPQGIIDLFPDGIINVHPSRLPAYRGPSPIEAVILNGDEDTAVSLMKLTAEMDAGPVYAQEAVPLSGKEDRLSLSRDLAEVGARFLVARLPEIVDKRLKPQAQDDVLATYTQLLKKDDGLTEWQEPAELLERKTRAYLGFPKLRGSIYGHPVVILASRLAESENDGRLLVQCKPGWLEITKLIAPSGRIMSGADFIRGYGS